MLSKDIRESLIKALQNPELYEAHAAEIHVVGRAAYEVDTISLSEDDFLLDSNEHNRPLYLEGILNRKPVKRILVDPGSAVNLLPLRTLRKVGHQPRDLEAAVSFRGLIKGAKKKYRLTACQPTPRPLIPIRPVIPSKPRPSPLPSFLPPLLLL